MKWTMLDIHFRNQLRSRAHELKPVVSVGKKGYSDALVKEVEAALLAHELIKIQFQKSASGQIEEIAEALCKALGAQQVELRGHVATLYRENPEK